MRSLRGTRLMFWASVATVAYVYVGYPVTVTLLAALRGHAPAGDTPRELPWVTLLIAAHDEERVIGRKIEESLALDYPAGRLQVMVASDGSKDATLDVVRSFAPRGVSSSHSPARDGKTAAVTRAMRSVDTEIVVFSDANNRYDPDAIRALVAPFSDRSVGVVTGAKVVVGNDPLGGSEGLYWRYEDFVKRQESRLGCCTGTAGEVLAIRRALWEDPPPGVINDDFWIAARAIHRGWRVVYEPTARSTETVSASPESEMVRRTRIVAGRYQAMRYGARLLPRDRPIVAWQMVSHKFMRPIVPFAMIGALAANIAAAAARHPAGLVPATDRGSTWMLLAAQSVFYAFALSGRRIGGNGRLAIIAYVPRFIVDSNAAAIIGLVRYACGRQSAAWDRPVRND